MSEFYEKFGEIVFQKRKSLGLSQAQLADQLGISQPTLTRLERGRCLADLGTLIKVSNILKIDLANLVKRYA